MSARFVRVHVIAWHDHPSLRLEIVGCQECNEVISVQPFAEITASSFKKWRHRNKSCMPDMGDIDSTKGWCPRRQNGNFTTFIGGFLENVPIILVFFSRTSVASV